MKLRSPTLLLAVLISIPAAAQEAPGQVTDADITKYKSVANTSCRDAGARQGDPNEKIEAFCGCLMTTLNKSMTRADWQQAYFYSMKGQSKEEMQVLGPHLKNVAACQPKPPEPTESPKEQVQQPQQPPPVKGQGLRAPR